MECLLDPALQHRILNALLGGDDSVVDKKEVSKHLEIARTASGALSADCVFEELATKLSKMKSAGFVALESGQASKIEEENGSSAGRKSSKLPGLLEDVGIDNEQKDIIMYVLRMGSWFNPPPFYHTFFCHPPSPSCPPSSLPSSHLHTCIHTHTVN
jgi:hypothetical protein